MYRAKDNNPKKEPLWDLMVIANKRIKRFGQLDIQQLENDSCSL